jgi:hypothetical protein
MNWIAEGKMLYGDIKKLQALVASESINRSTPDYLELESINRLLDENKNVKHYFPGTVSSCPWFFPIANEKTARKIKRRPFAERQMICRIGTQSFLTKNSKHGDLTKDSEKNGIDRYA